MQLTKVDRLAVSYRGPEHLMFNALGSVFSHADTLTWEDTSAAHGFTSASAGSLRGMKVAWTAWGGASQNGRSYFDVTGRGCSLVRDWDDAAELFSSLPEARVTRVDLAADFIHGERCYDEGRAAYMAGRFNLGGRRPKITEYTHGGDPNEGRTMYIGRTESDQQAVGYEKGLKEFQAIAKAGGGGLAAEHGPRSPSLQFVSDQGEHFTPADWFRWELRLRRHSRPVPFDVLPERDHYFAGAYPFFAAIFPEVTPGFLLRPERAGELEVAKALQNIQRQYGSTLFTALTVYGGDVFEVWRRIIGSAHNKRLIESGAMLSMEPFAEERMKALH